ncbi:LOW QUALITY PROTEIN: mucin-19 [Drosophila tropicalis]|uniref:LOW QUALITY PROTEIN: mucin-19 n=1 Tax=Drosophila tropicalis TaxID=46794 RepID=UPI0035ABDCF8
MDMDTDPITTNTNTAAATPNNSSNVSPEMKTSVIGVGGSAQDPSHQLQESSGPAAISGGALTPRGGLQDQKHEATTFGTDTVVGSGSGGGGEVNATNTSASLAINLPPPMATVAGITTQAACPGAGSPDSVDQQLGSGALTASTPPPPPPLIVSIEMGTPTVEGGGGVTPSIGPAVDRCPSGSVTASSAAASTCPASMSAATSVSLGPSASDFDSDTELSIVAAAAAAAAAATSGIGMDTSMSSSGASLMSGSHAIVHGSMTGAGTAGGLANVGVTTNGHNNGISSAQLSLNAKQQRQQKRRRERAQRLQAERDNRCNSSSNLNATFIAGGAGSATGGAGVPMHSAVSMGTGVAGGQNSVMGATGGVGGGAAPSVLMGSGPGGPGAGPGNGILYHHINSAGSMGEDSNNSNGNFTSSSNGSNNNLLPPTDSIASLLLNPPHSPECNSGLMATPSDSEGESLDEDLLSTSSSSTLLLPRDKPPPRPPPPVRRKLPRSPVLEEEIIDGFAILEFKTYEDLEFAIKLGQKRKEKRLSALEELTCTYSIEEMKMPKIIDTGQPHPLRGSNLSALSVVGNNNNLKEQLHHRTVGGPLVVGGVGGGGNNGGGVAISANSNNNNNNTSTSNNNSGVGTSVYMLPSAASTTDTHATEPVAHWRSQYQQQQQDQLMSSSNANQNQISNSCNSQQQQQQQQQHVMNMNHVNKSKHAADKAAVTNGGGPTAVGPTAGGVGGSGAAALMEMETNGNDAHMLDISRPTLAVGTSSSTSSNNGGNNISASNGNGSGSGNANSNDVASSNQHNNPTSNCNANQPNTASGDVSSNSSTEYNMTVKGTKSNDAAAATTTGSGIGIGATSKSNHLGAAQLSSSSSPSSQSCKTIVMDNNEGAISSNSPATAIAVHPTLGIPDLPNGSAQVVGATNNMLKNDHDHTERFIEASNHCNSNGKGTHICDSGNVENKNSESLVGAMVFPSTQSHMPNTSPSQQGQQQQQTTTTTTSARKSSEFLHLQPIGPTGVGNHSSGSDIALSSLNTASDVGSSAVESSSASSPLITTNENGEQQHSTGGAPGAPPIVATIDGSNSQGPMVQKSATEKTMPHPMLGVTTAPSPGHVGLPGIVPVSVEANVTTKTPTTVSTPAISTPCGGLGLPSAASDQSIMFSSKMPTPQGLAAAGQRPPNPLMLGAQMAPVTVAAASLLGNTFGTRIPAPTAGLIGPPSTAGVLLANSSLKPNENATSRNPASTITGAPSSSSSSSTPPTPANMDMLKNTNVLSMPPNTQIVNGFLGGFPSVSGTTSTSGVNSALSRISPHTTNKMVPVPVPVPVPVSTTMSAITTMPNSVVPSPVSAAGAAVAGLGKVAFGGSASGGAGPPLLFPGAPPPPMSHVAANLPMLIQAAPYRAPYPNYPLYTPYGSLTHGPYLPPVLSVASPTTASSPHRSADVARSSRESPASAVSIKAPPPNISNSVQPGAGLASVPAGMRPITPLPGGGSVISASSAPSAQNVTTVVAATAATTMLPLNSTHSLNHPHSQSHSHHMPVYAAGPFGVGTSVPSSATGASGPTPHAITSMAAITSQSLQPPPPNNVQLPLQSATGHLSHGPAHLLTTHPQFATPIPSQHQPHLRGVNTSAAASVAGGNFSSSSSSASSVLTVQSLTTAVTASPSSMSASASALTSSSSTSSTSVIQKVISPKSESNTNIKDRDNSYSITTVRSNMAASSSSSISGVQPAINLGPPFCGLVPGPYGGGVSATSASTLPSNSQHTVLATAAGSGLTPYPPKTGLWLNSTATSLPAQVTTSTPSMVVVSSGNARPTPPPPINVVGTAGGGSGVGPRTAGNAISPHVNVHMPGAPPSNNQMPVSTYQPSYFTAPLPPPSLSPAANNNQTAATPNSAMVSQHMPMVSHAPPSITTTTAATTTTPSSSSSTVGAMPSTVTTASNTMTPTPHPFSAESLFQPSKNDQADLLRRELDSRFLDRSGLAVPPTPPSSTYMRQELHQHQHTHLHQHQQLLPGTSMAPAPTPALPAAPPTPAQIFPPPLFKDISKISAVDPQFYRTGIGLPPGYTGYSSAGLLHAGLGGPTPFMPPNHLTSFAPKNTQSIISTPHSNNIPTTSTIDPSKSSQSSLMKSGRWNAMHVRIAWEIYYHQNKQNSDKAAGCPMPGSSSFGNSSVSGGNPITPNVPINPGNIGSGASAASGSGSGANTPVSNVGTPSVPGGAGVGVGGGVPVQGAGAPGVAVPSGPTPPIGIKASPTLALSTSSPHLMHRPGEMPPAAVFANTLPGRSPFEASPLAASFIGAPPSHIGTSVAPYGRYVTPFGFTGLTHFGREISLAGPLDAWRTSAMQRTVAYHPASASASNSWPIKTDPALDNARREAEERERERELREREQRERDRQRREREERERKEKEEKLKREQQERERERERERDRKERERRELERRELERERMLQQQRINESNKQAAAQAAAVAAAAAPVRDRSPHRSVVEMNAEIRIKEEHPRTKEEQDVMMMRASAAAAAVGDPRYHPSSLAAAQASAAAAAAHHHHANFMAAGRQCLPPPPTHLSRTMMAPTLSVGGPLTHYPPPGPPGWGMDHRDYYAPLLRFNPIMEAAFRHEHEERQKAMSIYAAQSAAHLRGKEPSPIPPPSVGTLGPPPPHHRMQPTPGVGVVTSGPQTPQQQQQQQQQQMSTGIVVGKVPGPPQPTTGMPVQHMIAVDPLNHSSITTKKEQDHAMGMVVSGPGPGVGLSTGPGGVMGISPASSVAPSR